MCIILCMSSIISHMTSFTEKPGPLTKYANPIGNSFCASPFSEFWRRMYFIAELNKIREDSDLPLFKSFNLKSNGKKESFEKNLLINKQSQMPSYLCTLLNVLFVSHLALYLLISPSLSLSFECLLLIALSTISTLLCKID